MNALTRLDTSALNRALVGFDTLWNDLEHRFANQMNTNYPPYNVLKRNEDTYEIQVAVSGFDKDEVTVEVDQSQLIIRGQRKEAEAEDIEFLHRGLAARDFTRMFTLAEHMEVGEGRIKNGILSVEIKRIVPEALKPRTIRIKAD